MIFLCSSTRVSSKFSIAAGMPYKSVWLSTASHTAAGNKAWAERRLYLRVPKSQEPVGTGLR